MHQPTRLLVHWHMFTYKSTKNMYKIDTLSCMQIIKSDKNFKKSKKDKKQLCTFIGDLL